MAESSPEDLVIRSAALLEATGFQLVRLAHPVGAWPLLTVSPRGLTLVAAVPERPNLMGGTYTVPAGWPIRHGAADPDLDDGPLPTALTLS